MTVLMDDPSTYLTRDNDVPMVLLAPNVQIASAIAKQYGVSIQVNGPDPQKGIRVVTNEAEAIVVMGNLVATTPWAAIPGSWSLTTYQRLIKYFGPPLTLAKAFNVTTKGIAWRPDRMMV